MAKWYLLIFAFVLISSVFAFPLEPGQTSIQQVGSYSIIVEMIGFNLANAPGTVFLSVNGVKRFIENGSTSTFGDVTLAVSRVDIWDNYSGGTAYITLRADESCVDGIRNQDESDVDCGGMCASCASGRICYSNTDCSQRSCLLGRCEGGSLLQNANPTCFDGLQNQGERGVDCAGPCSRSCILSVRNISVFCGEGCFFFNDHCECPFPPPNRSIPHIDIEINESPIEEVINKSAPFNVSEKYLTSNGEILLIGTRQGRLFGLIPVGVPMQLLMFPNGTAIASSSPRWAVFAP